MSSEKPECPICNEPLPAHATECPRCGFRLLGETVAFRPITSDQLEQAAKSNQGVPALEVVSGPYEGESFVLGKGTFTLGRDPKCDVFLNNTTVSRHHATIVVDDSGATIEDAGSLNGTWVDGHVSDKSPLVSGSSVQIGTFNMMFRYLEN